MKNNIQFLSVTDRVRDREHIDLDFHIDRSMVRDMFPTEVQVYHWASKKCDHRNLGGSPDIWYTFCLVEQHSLSFYIVIERNERIVDM